MKRTWFSLAALLLLMTLGTTTARANHLLAMTMSWEPTAVSTATTHEVKFTLTAYFRISALVNDGQVSSSVAAGDKFCEGGGGMSINFGDGSAATGPLCFIITNVDNTTDILTAVAIQNSSATVAGVFHTYDNTQSSYPAVANGCCRATSTILNNRAVDDFNMVTTAVTPFDGNRSPVSTTTMPIIVVPEAPAGGFRTFQISATDPNGDNITYRLATNAEATGFSGSAHDGPTSEAGQPAMSINSTTGVVTWYDHGLDHTKYYTQQFIAEDRDANGNVKSTTAIDLLLTLCNNTTAPSINVALDQTSCSPPSGGLVDVAATVTTSDPNAHIVLTSITSSQAESGLSACDVPDDIQGDTTGTFDTHFKLRCEAFGSPRTYTVAYTVTDGCENSRTGTATFTVTPAANTPTIAVTLSPNSSSNPNHSLVDVHANVTVGNTCSANYTVQLISLTSNQAESGLGSGDVADDIQNETLNTDDRDFKLRAETYGGTRTYTATYRVTDECCRVATTTATFTVSPTPLTINVCLTPNCGTVNCSHSLQCVNASVSVSGACTSSYTVTLFSLTSNQADAGLGSGDLANDIQNANVGTDDRSFNLRNEAYGTRRVYTAIYRATDACGRVAYDTATYTVNLPSTPLSINVYLSPNNCTASCSNHCLVDVHAYLTTGGCSSDYDVDLVSITSNQAQSGLGSGDVANDIQNANLGTDDRYFSLRCEAYGSARVYRVVYRVTDCFGRVAYDTACFNVNLPSPPRITVCLSPSNCTAGSTHCMKDVHASITLFNCGGGYDVDLVSITSNQAQSGLGSGDVSDDIQNEVVGSNDRYFNLRCEAIGGTRVYTVIYKVTDCFGREARDTAYFTVYRPSNNSGTCHNASYGDHESYNCNHSWDDDDDCYWGHHKAATGSGDESGAGQGGIELSQNRPNPFNVSTTIDYMIGKPGDVTLSIVSRQGQVIRRLTSEHLDAGNYTAQWDGLDNNGMQAPSGTYFYWLESTGCNCVQVKSLVLQR